MAEITLTEENSCQLKKKNGKQEQAIDMHVKFRTKLVYTGKKEFNI